MFTSKICLLINSCICNLIIFSVVNQNPNNNGKDKGADNQSNDFMDAGHMVHYWDEDEEIQQYFLD